MPYNRGRTIAKRRRPAHPGFDLRHFASAIPGEQKFVPDADEQEFTPTGEILRKCNSISIDTSDESAFLSGLRVVGPTFA
jgi:hypothetical protein